MSPFQTPVCVNPPWIQFLSAFNSPVLRLEGNSTITLRRVQGHHPGRWLGYLGSSEPTEIHGSRWIFEGTIHPTRLDGDWHWYIRIIRYVYVYVIQPAPWGICSFLKLSVTKSIWSNLFSQQRLAANDSTVD